jgi:hypothetical protein
VIDSGGAGTVHRVVRGGCPTLPGIRLFTLHSPRRVAAAMAAPPTRIGLTQINVSHRSWINVRANLGTLRA